MTTPFIGRLHLPVIHNWSTINSTLYTICFLGRATSTPQCELCCTSTHTAKECAQQGDPDPGLQDRLKAMETAVLALTSKSPVTLMTAPKMANAPLSNRMNHAENGIAVVVPTLAATIIMHVAAVGGATQQYGVLSAPHSMGQATYSGALGLSSRHFSQATKPNLAETPDGS